MEPLPATPYVVGGACVAGVGYKAYRYCYPTDEEQIKQAHQAFEKEAITSKIDFHKCLKMNMSSARNVRGVPTACQEISLSFILHHGEQKYDETVHVFNKSCPQ